MPTIREWVNRLRDFAQRKRLAAELDEELRHHRLLLERDARAAGLDTTHAHNAALRAFGNVTVHTEETRDMWSFARLDSLMQDVRFALRSFRRAPSFTAVVLITLALGIGANTAVFSVVDAILLRPLPYPNADRLVAVWPSHFVGAAELEYVQQHAQSFEGGAAILSPGWGSVLSHADAATQVSGARVSTNFFRVLGLTPLLGRTFVDGESAPGKSQVVLLSHDLWRTTFGSDSGIVGQSVVIDGTAATVVGVMRPGYSIFQADAQLWMPLQIDPTSSFYKGSTGFFVGRLARNATIESATREVRSLLPAIRAAFAFDDKYGSEFSIAPLQESIVGSVRTTLWVLTSAVAFLVLIAGANVANLLLARAGDRRTEIAVRSALGASRARVIRQLLIESLMLAVAGGALGFAMGAFGLMALKGMLPPGLPRVESVSIDWRVLATTAAITLGVGLLFSLAPALFAARSDTGQTMRSSRGSEHLGLGRRLRSALVVAEVAMALVLVIGAGLMSETMWRLSHVDTGFQTDHVFTLRIQPSGATYGSNTLRLQYFDRVFEAVRGVPGVQQVGAIQHLPLSGFNWHRDMEIEGRAAAVGAKPFNAGYRNIGGDYFAVMRIPLLKGRAFEPTDDSAHPPVALVNQRFAEQFFPGENPIGRRFKPQRMNWVTIVGVVGNVRHMAVTTPPEAEFFLRSNQVLQSQMQVVVRTSGDPALVARNVYDRVAALDRTVPVSNLMTLSSHASASVAQPRVVMTLMLAFAVVGLTLGAVGIYGVVNYTVANRRREIGIRMALGASGGGVARMVLREGATNAAIGVVIGLGAAWLLSRAMQSLVFEVSPTDAVTYALVSLGLMLVALLASWIPARQASRVDPVRALRAE